MNVISEVRFIPIKENNKKSIIGFITFVYKSGIEMRDMAVHRKLEGGYRVTYPKNKESNKQVFRPITKEAQEDIDKEITKYMEELNGK